MSRLAITRSGFVVILLLAIAVAAPIVALSNRNGEPVAVPGPVDPQLGPGGDPHADWSESPPAFGPRPRRGQLGDHMSYNPTISADGRWVAFASHSSNLVPNDTNRVGDIFVKDLANGNTTRVSVSSMGRQANAWSSVAAISADGRFIAFISSASTLVRGDTNRCAHSYSSISAYCPDVFVHDRVRHTTVRVSVSSRGAQADDASDGGVAISGDGHFVAFGSEATNLVAGDTNNDMDVFLHDMRTGTTSRVSIAGDRAQGQGSRPSISLDGSRIVFLSTASSLDRTGRRCRMSKKESSPCQYVFLRNLKTGITSTVVRAPMAYEGPAISGDGRYVGFTSPAGNLVRGDTNGKADTFVYDETTRSISRVSVSSTEKQGNGDSGRPAITEDGRYVAFSTGASNLVPRDKRICERLDDNERYSCLDVLVRDRVAGTTTIVSLSTKGAQADWNSFEPAISAAARRIVFASEAGNLSASPTVGCAEYNCPNIFVRDRFRGTTKPVSTATPGVKTLSDGYGSDNPSVSGDGSVVAFTTSFTKFVARDTNATDDIMVWRRGRDLERISTSFRGTQANGPSATPIVSDDGSTVAFVSAATNLIPGNTNGQRNIFVVDLTTDRIERVTVSSLGEQADGPSWGPRLSADGRYVVFTSNATNLVPGDTNAAQDVFLYDRSRDRMTRVSVSSNGEQANGHSGGGSISADGTRIAFASAASNLDKGDTEVCINRPNRKDKPPSTCVDVFVRDLETKETFVASVTDRGRRANGDSDVPSISGDGRYVAFPSGANNLTGEKPPGDANAGIVYIRDLDRRRTTMTGQSAHSSALDQSFDGRYLLLTNTVLDRSTGEVIFIDNCGPSRPGHLASGGRFLVWDTDCNYGGDQDAFGDVYLFDLVTRTKQWISRPPL